MPVQTKRQDAPEIKQEETADNEQASKQVATSTTSSETTKPTENQKDAEVQQQFSESQTTVETTKTTENQQVVVNETPVESQKIENTQPIQTQESSNSAKVWIPNTGSKYHIRSSCSNMKNPTQVTKEAAENMGYDPCKKCY